MIIWIDAHLSPAIALWINQTFTGIEAKSLRSLGLRDSIDLDIFNRAKEAGVVLMTKDSDFINLLQKYGPPPQVIWLTFGNTSNKRLVEILSKNLLRVINLLKGNEAFVEIRES